MIIYYSKRFLARFVSDSLYAKLVFLRSHLRLPRNPPVSFNEFLFGLKCSGALAEFQQYADKCAVRDHVARKIGAKHLMPRYMTAERLTREVWDRLPESFVIKTNHGSRWNRIIWKKSEENFSAVAAQMNGYLKRNFYYIRREQQYKRICPKLIFEELLYEKWEEQIIEHKLFCFHGAVKFLLCAKESGKQKFNYYYSRDWKKLDVVKIAGPDKFIPRPEMLDQMIEVAEKLAEDFSFVRVDLFNIDGNVYFNELTFVPGGGSGRFRTTEFEETIGRLWRCEDVDLTRFECRQNLSSESLAGHQKPGARLRGV